MNSVVRNLSHFHFLRELKINMFDYDGLNRDLDKDQIDEFYGNFAKKVMQNTTLTKFEFRYAFGKTAEQPRRCTAQVVVAAPFCEPGQAPDVNVSLPQGSRVEPFS